PSSLDFQKKWFENLKNDTNNQRFAVDTPDLGFIGTANLVDINWKDNNAFHGMMLGDKDVRGKGYGIDTIMAIMRYAFEELHLERLDSSMIEYNQISVSIYCNKLNWKEEGRQRNWYFRKNKYWDRIIVGITKDDYFELIEKTNYWIVK
ncbi:MAG: GNAT family N-acetyltransferase, partial [Bacteroidetes bacterium]|nr:GNAT family N-acetyltransferase [Bacteroidota bacterium]